MAQQGYRLVAPSRSHEHSNPSTFILLGIPGLETAHIWISIPFCATYAIAVLGNFTILFIVKMEPNLCGPMFFFLCMLAVTDLVMSTSTVPKMLSIFWFNSRESSFSAYLTQMYFVHSLSGMESGILVAMAFDRYVDICHPLRHSTTLTNSVVAKIGLAVVLRSGIFALPYPFLHRAVGKLACADISISSYYGLFHLLSEIRMEGFFIAMSYTQILRAIFCLPTKDARLKTFGTCISHLCAISALYIPDLFYSLMLRFGHNVPLHFLILIVNLYHLIPPVLHHIIYGVRAKQIQDRLLQLFTHKET
uniref:G-protein coupled receptors family 1 profile domain-containing protein n=1 Tax=Chelonoidis abingdonii TaxID=106734 RepID=A0A8C0G7V8_CHEAB